MTAALESDERGSTTVEMVLAFSMLLAIVLLSFHFAFLFNANQAVEDAAQEALDALSASGGNADDAQFVVAQILDADASVTQWHLRVAERGPETTRIVITAEGSRILPGLPVNIRRAVVGPTERFTTVGNR